MGLIEDLREVGRRLRGSSAVKAISDACEGFGIRCDIVRHACFGDGLADLFAKIAKRVEKEYVPVPLGKDGKPLEVGRHYFGKDGRRWTVLGFKPGAYDVVGECDEEVNAYLKGCWLSVERPDTQERIDADKDEPMPKYWGCEGSACCNCPAMVDRKTPAQQYGFHASAYNCRKAQGYDLALRQMRLDASKGTR